MQKKNPDEHRQDARRDYRGYLAATRGRSVQPAFKDYREQVRDTLAYLQRCRRARGLGLPVSYVNDPAWLVDMAINRRAGWPDDPSHSRGSAMPVGGKYPKKAEGDWFWELFRIAHTINGSRVVLYERSIGAVRRFLLRKIPHRITRIGEESW